MTNLTPPTDLIEFPCKYPFKIIGHNVPELLVTIINTLNNLQVKYYEQDMISKPSSKNHYISITLEVDVVDRIHLEEIHKALNASEYIKMIL